MKRKTRTQYTGSRALFALALVCVGACLIPGGKLLASLRAAGVSHKALTFAERVVYQRSIEEVYWRHRIWPKENRGSKPPFDNVISQQEVEKKVEDYLRKSQALEDYWQRPITAEQLQAEMDRMAEHTQQPEVLRELFAALGNDLFVVAECLVRPILAERLVDDLTSRGQPADVIPSNVKESRDTALDSITRSLARARGDIYKLPEISVPLDCTDDTWTGTTTINAPTGRSAHTAIWTGSEMIIWGGVNNSFSGTRSGGRYNPSTDTWTTTSTINAPAARSGHTAVWTGSEMIVWGGLGASYLNSGGRYNPTTNSWTVTSTANAPDARAYHTTVWTGSEMVVWGGAIGNEPLNTGGRYNPTTNSWAPTTTTNAPSARDDDTAVWAGSEMIVWGGDYIGSLFDTGGRYNPITDSWAATSAINAPSARDYHTAVWTGSEMIVWGGITNGSSQTGGRYSPSTDSWIPTSTTNAPAGRHFHTAVWTGSEMIVWGGNEGSSFNTGGRFDPNTDSWTSTSTTNAPAARDFHTAVFTGSEMIVWGGFTPSNNTGGRYCVQPNTPFVQGAVSQKSHGTVGSFGVALPLSGAPGMECRSGSTTGDYTIIVTFLADISVNGNPQAAMTSGTGTIGSGGVSNGGMVMTSGNVVTIPLTNVTNAQTINVTLNNVNGSTNVTIPMRVLIGDVNGTGTVNSSDVVDTKMCAGQTVSANNFRCDVDAGGAINATDLSVVKSASGTGLP